VVGGAPGRERLPLPSARTVFGRAEADVDLGDPAVSGRHFQVEAAGREFFIRDLGSRNGTFVNGRRIRYAELLPGDEVLAGSTYLVFRTSQDALGRPAG
jgi:adenylate cyclase